MTSAQIREMLIMLSNFPTVTRCNRRRPEPAARLDRARRGARSGQAVDRLGRRWAHGQLRPVARADAPDRHPAARARTRPQRPRRAARQQFDRASHLLFRRDGLRRDHLHRPCRDEPQPARQHLRAAGAEARALPGRLAARRPARHGVGAAPAARPLGRARGRRRSSARLRAARRRTRTPTPGRTTMR